MIDGHRRNIAQLLQHFVGSQRPKSGADQTQDLQYLIDDLARNEAAEIQLYVLGVSHREHRNARLDAGEYVRVFGQCVVSECIYVFNII